LRFFVVRPRRHITIIGQSWTFLADDRHHIVHQHPKMKNVLAEIVQIKLQ